MKRFLFPLVAIALVQSPAAEAQLPSPNPDLASAIAAGVPFRVHLNPGANNGSLMGGQEYDGRYNPDTQSYTVSGPALGSSGVIPVTATYREGQPLARQINLFGAEYTFDRRGYLFQVPSGRLAGRLWLAMPGRRTHHFPMNPYHEPRW